MSPMVIDTHGPNLPSSFVVAAAVQLPQTGHRCRVQHLISISIGQRDEADIRLLRRVMVSNFKKLYNACMVGKNIFIRPPYVECPKCGKQAFGLIYVGGSKLAKRCAECDCIRHDALPDLDKKVIYVDQNLFSYLFQHENGGKLPEGHEPFIHDVHAKLRRLVLLQQVVMPMSDIHFDESLVFFNEKALRHAIEFLGGDARLKDVPDLELAQTLISAKAFLNNSEAEYPDSIDLAMDSRRNDWLPDMHITTNVDFSQFADDVRKTRDQGHADMRKIFDRWASQKMPFKDVLAEELNSMPQNKLAALAACLRRFQRAMQSSDPGELFEVHGNPVYREYKNLERLFSEHGFDNQEAPQKIKEFWNSEQCKKTPHHVISSYLFAALARRIANGMKPEKVTRGIINDVRAISNYVYHVDAMFIDRECANMLAEGPLNTDLSYKAKIFSFSNTGAFLAYLDEIDSQTPENVRSNASMIYGLD